MLTELEKEAVNYLLKRLSIDIDEFEKWKENARSEVKFIVDCYVAGAEPREKRIVELEAKIVHLTQHLEPQAMTTLFEQVEEEVKQEQKIKDLEKENAKLKEEKCINKTCVVLKDKEDCVAQLLELEKENAELKGIKDVATLSD